MTTLTKLKMVKDLTDEIYQGLNMFGCEIKDESEKELARSCARDVACNMYRVEMEFLSLRDESHKPSEEDIPDLVARIGEPAMLEQLAEECCELGHAALKQAREMRDENRTHQDPEVIRNNLIEELADVSISIYQVIKNTNLVTEKEVQEAFERKNERMKARFKEEDDKERSTHGKS